MDLAILSSWGPYTSGGSFGRVVEGKILFGMGLRENRKVRIRDSG